MLKLFKKSKLLFFFILILLSCSSTSINSEESSVDKNQSTSIKSIYIECDQKEYQSINNKYKENTYIPVTVSYNGKKWENVKLRIRGDSSRKLPKKSLKLKFSKKAPFINGLSKINLNAEWYDKTYMTQYLSSYLMRKEGVHCFNSEHVYIYLNNKFHGIYLMIENVDKSFLTSRNISPSETLYKATKDGANFNDTSEVYHLWEKKTNKKDLSREDLKQFIIELNQLSDKDSYNFYKNKFEYDRLLSAIALNILTGNKSTYYHNYYLLHNNEEDKWNYIPWDMDKTLTKNLLNLHYARSTWCEGINSNLADNPIPEYIFLNKKMRKDLINRINKITNETFNIKHLEPIIDSLRESLSLQVNLDNTDNIKSNEVWSETILELKNFIKTRPKIIAEQIEKFPSPFIVFPAESTKISWSKSDSQTKVTYTLNLCSDYNFKKEAVHSFKTKDNEVTISGLESGEYYYYVNAENASGMTTGFRIKQKILIK
jgi:spore coat protein H